MNQKLMEMMITKKQNMIKIMMQNSQNQQNQQISSLSSCSSSQTIQIIKQHQMDQYPEIYMNKQKYIRKETIW